MKRSKTVFKKYLSLELINPKIIQRDTRAASKSIYE